MIRVAPRGGRGAGTGVGTARRRYDARCGSRRHFCAVWSADAARDGTFERCAARGAVRGGNLVRFGGGCGPGAVRGGTFERCGARMRREVAISCGLGREVALSCAICPKNRTNLPLRGPRRTGLPLRGTERSNLPPRWHRGPGVPQHRAPQPRSQEAPQDRSTEAAARQPVGTTGPQPGGTAAAQPRSTVAPQQRSTAAAQPRSPAAQQPGNPATPTPPHGGGRTRGQDMPGSAGMSPLTWEDTTVFKARERAPHAVHDFVPCTPDLPGSCVRISAIDSWAR